MDMKWFVFFTVKEERKAENLNTSWHILFVFYFYAANIGIIFDTSKFFCNF